MPVIFSSSWQVCEIFGARSGPASDVCEFVYVWLCGRLFSQLELAICCREPLHDVCIPGQWQPDCLLGAPGCSLLLTSSHPIVGFGQAVSPGVL